MESNGTDVALVFFSPSGSFMTGAGALAEAPVAPELHAAQPITQAAVTRRSTSPRDMPCPININEMCGDI